MAKREKPDQDACLAAAVSLATDPLRFVSLCWPDMQLYGKQREVLLSVRDNVETFVHAANETGKTRIAAVAVLWFFAGRTPARVVTSSSSETQLNAILWSEIHNLIRTSRFPLPFLAKNLCLKKLRRLGSTETEPSDYVLGYVTNTVENFQGHHLPNDRPRVLAVFDEASGVSGRVLRGRGFLGTPQAGDRQPAVDDQLLLSPLPGRGHTRPGRRGEPAPQGHPHRRPGFAQRPDGRAVEGGEEAPERRPC